MRIRGPLALVVLCLVPLGLWMAAQPLDSRFIDARTTLTSIAVCLALVGTSAFALNLVLGARFGVVDELFGGLDKMFRVHQINGRVAFLFLLGHATLIVASRATDSASARRENCRYIGLSTSKSADAAPPSGPPTCRPTQYVPRMARSEYAPTASRAAASEAPKVR